MENTQLRRIVWLISLCAIILSNEGHSQNILLQEDFIDNHRNWEISNSETEVTYVKDGKYFIKVNEISPTHWHWFSIMQSLPANENWLFETTIHLDRINEDDFVGIMWGGKDANNMLQAYYYPKHSTFSSAYFRDTSYYKLFDRVKVDSISPNKIKFSILKTEKKYYCLINGRPVGKCSISPSLGDKIGFIASGKAEISVEDLVIKKLDKANQIASLIKSKFPSTEERIVYYNKLDFPWKEGFASIPKEESETYRTYTIDDNDSIMGYVREYSTKTGKLLSKFQAREISSFSKHADILDGEQYEYNDDGEIEMKAIFYNYDLRPDKDFKKSPTSDLYKFNRKGRLIAYRSIKDGILKLDVSLDDNGRIEKAQNTSDDFYYEANAYGGYDKVYEEDFDPPKLTWLEMDIESSTSRLTKQGYYIKAKTGDAARISKIDVDFNNSDFSISCFIDMVGSGSASLLLGVDNKGLNYTDYSVSSDGQYTVFNLFNGVRIPVVDWTPSSNPKKGGFALDIIKIGKKVIYSMNGTQIQNADYFPLAVNSIGLGVIGLGNEAYFKNMVIKEINSPLPDEFSKFVAKTHNQPGYLGSGTGFFVSNAGYIVTNNHVIDNAKEIFVDVNENGQIKTYKATLVKTDPLDDLAILKISKTTPSIIYPINAGLIDVGSKVFTLGYPYALSYLGKEIKFTEGSISSKTGFANDINTYQISVPVQPGNSGGPLFDTKGNLVGIVNARFTKGDNVSYAIKSSVLKSFLNIIPTASTLRTELKTEELSITSLIKRLEQSVVLIKIK